MKTASYLPWISLGMAFAMGGSAPAVHAQSKSTTRSFSYASMREEQKAAFPGGNVLKQSSYLSDKLQSDDVAGDSDAANVGSAQDNVLGVQNVASTTNNQSTLGACASGCDEQATNTADKILFFDILQFSKVNLGDKFTLKESPDIAAKLKSISTASDATDTLEIDASATLTDDGQALPAGPVAFGTEVPITGNIEVNGTTQPFDGILTYGKEDPILDADDNATGTKFVTWHVEGTAPDGNGGTDQFSYDVGELDLPVPPDAIDVTYNVQNN